MKFSSIIVKYLIVAFVLYVFGQMLLPTIAILNGSGVRVLDARITVSDTDLKFWTLGKGEDKQLSYSLFQKEGKYRYYFVLKNNITLSGECGYVKNLELLKSVIFLISDDKVVYSGEIR